MTEEEKSQILMSASFGVKCERVLQGLRVQRLHPHGIWVPVWEWEPVPIKGDKFKVGLTLVRVE